MTSKELTVTDQLKKTITTMGPQFQAALPKHINVDKFVRVLQTAISTTPALVEANRTTLFAACMKAAADGLLPDGRESAIVTFNSKSGKTAQYMPMIAGILKKIRNSGELASITSNIVFQNDQFRYWVDADGEHLIHEPNMFSDRGKRLGAYGIAKTKDGGIYIEVMTEQQINDVKNVSRSKDSGPWAGAFSDEMRKKTVLRRLAKKMPSSTDIEMTMAADDDLYMPDEEPTGHTDVTPPSEPVAPKAAKPKGPTKLKDAIKSAPVVEADDVIDTTANQVDDDIPDTPLDDDELPL